MDNKLFWYKATAIHVVDGGTIDLDIDMGMHLHVHKRIILAGISAPEIFVPDKESAEYAAAVAAKLFVEKKIMGKNLWINTCQYSPLINAYSAELYVQNEDGAHVSINKMLITEDLATKKD